MDELDLTEVEREICRLPDVSIVRLVAEPDGRISEVHVVAHQGKHPKQIVRDVQSIALASFGLEIDRRVISVVQLGGSHPRRGIRTRAAAVDRRDHRGGERAALVGPGHARTRRGRGRRLRRRFDRHDRAPPARGPGDRRLVASARARGRMRRRRSRADRADRRAGRRSRHRGVRDPAGRADGFGLGDRAPAARSRRRRPGHPRRDQPSPRVRLGSRSSPYRRRHGAAGGHHLVPARWRRRRVGRGAQMVVGVARARFRDPARRR